MSKYFELIFRRKSQKCKDVERQQLAYKNKLDEENESKINVLNKKIKNLEFDLTQFKEKARALDAQVNKFKMMQINTPNHKKGNQQEVNSNVEINNTNPNNSEKNEEKEKEILSLKGNLNVKIYRKTRIRN